MGFGGGSSQASSATTTTEVYEPAIAKDIEQDVESSMAIQSEAKRRRNGIQGTYQRFNNASSTQSAGSGTSGSQAKLGA